MSAIPEKYRDEWFQIVKSPIDDQANEFLKAFVSEFSGDKFEKLLDLASAFKRSGKSASFSSLEEHDAHMFLEKHGGGPVTAASLREKLKLIDADHDHRLSFLEFALYRYEKNIANFFTELHNPERGGGEAFRRAVDEYRAVLAKREARQAKMDELADTAEKGGVKAMAAKNELAQMQSEDQLALNKAEVTSAANKRKAEKNKIDPFEEEQQRAHADKAKREEEEKKQREEARGRLAAKAAMFNTAK